MKPSENDKHLDESITRAIGAEKIEADFAKFRQAHPEAVKTLTSSVERKAQNMPTSSQNIWRIIMKSRITKFAAAVIIIAVIIGISQFGTPFDANRVFADAMDSINQARTFSCLFINEQNRYGNKQVFKEHFMFKEPDRERQEIIERSYPIGPGEITITDFSLRQSLTLEPVEKTAVLDEDMSYYKVDPESGKLMLTKTAKLDTSLRDLLLQWSEEMVEDLGLVDLEGRSVRLLQSKKANQTKRVWIDPLTELPLQIELIKPDTRQVFASIQIDKPLDDDLFSLEPPAGYTLTRTDDASGFSVYQHKLIAKFLFLSNLIGDFENQHDGQYPVELMDLVTAQLITDDVLNTVLSATDDPDAPPVIRYNQPLPGARIRSEVLLYEDFDQWPESGILVWCTDMGFFECTNQWQFEDLLAYHSLKMNWPDTYKIELGAKMRSLVYDCLTYADQHEGQFPKELDDLVSADLIKGEILRLTLTAPGALYGPAAIRYRLPRDDRNPSMEVIFYEIVDSWPENGAVVCFLDRKCELITDQQRFEELIK